MGLPKEAEITELGVKSQSSDEDCAGSAKIFRAFECRPDDEQDELPLDSDFGMHDFQ